MVNNAGVQTWKPLLELEEHEWDRVIDTNLKGCFLCTQRAARHMKDAGGGAIVNIGSGCNKVPFPNLVDYTASKGGIEMFTRVAAAELGQYGIRVNCVAPGAIEIERTKLEAGGLRRDVGKTDADADESGVPAEWAARWCFWRAKQRSSSIARRSGWTAGCSACHRGRIDYQNRKFSSSHSSTIGGTACGDGPGVFHHFPSALRFHALLERSPCRRSELRRFDKYASCPAATP